MAETGINSNCAVFIVNGMSMNPTLKDGDKVVIKSFPVSGIKKRDIIVFNGNKALTCHRVIKILNGANETIFYTRGDSNIEGERVFIDNIVGKVIAIYRNEKPKFVSFENSFTYCLFITAFSVFKNILIKFTRTINIYKIIRPFFYSKR